MGQHEDERARFSKIDFDLWGLEDLPPNDSIQQ